MGLAGIVGSAMAQSQSARGDLEFRYPDVRIADSREWVSSVFGTPMTWGETPRAAADDWLASYAPVLVGEWCYLDYVSSLKLRDGRVALTYRQTVDELEVLDSRVKVLTHEADGGYRVGFVGAKLARDFETRIGDVLVTAGEAELAAIQSEPGQKLDTFSEPELVANGAEGEDLGDARVVWRLHGWNEEEESVGSWVFLVDAVTGDVVAYPNILHFTDTITGTVTGNGTPGLRPDIPEPSDCENEPVSMAIRLAQVQLVDGGNVLKTVYTDASGDYEISLPSIPSTAEVVFETRGLAWAMWEWEDWEEPPVNLMATASYPVSGTFPEVIDHEFNASPVSEAQTATVNTMIHVEKTWRFFLERLASEPPGLDHELEVYPDAGGPFYWPLGKRLVVGPPNPPACPTATHQENSAYATIIAHEYAHYFLWEIFGVTESPSNAPFHEGFADTVALLLYDVDEVGLDFYGCDTCTRRPLLDDPMYPVCYPFADGCCSFGVKFYHTRGELLSATWLDLRSLLGLSATQDLFVGWAQITGGGRPEPSGCDRDPAFPFIAMLQSADLATLIEVLTADDDDNDLSNGTPNQAEICQAFAGRGIESPPGLGLCGDSAGGGICQPDLNHDGTLDFFDVLRFQDLFGAGDPRSDFTCDGVLDFFDWLEFQTAFAAGCR